MPFMQKRFDKLNKIYIICDRKGTAAADGFALVNSYLSKKQPKPWSGGCFFV